MSHIPSDRAFWLEERASMRTDWIEQLSAPVPRYTSYPPANYFHEMVDPSGIQEDIQTSPRPVSLYVHIPYCRKRCFFCGCNTEQRRRYGDTPRTVDALISEIKQWSGLISANRPLVDIHWGGGTPNFLQPRDMERLGQAIRDHFSTDSRTRFSVEIDPRELQSKQPWILSAMGCTRASIGVQDTQLEVQQAIGRVQPKEVTAKAVAALRNAGIEAINIDLIYGLPGQTEASIRETIREVLELQPNRLAIFGYAHLPSRLKIQNVIERRGGIPEVDLRYRLLLTALETLADAGFVHLGLDHFALPEDPLTIASAEGRMRRNFNGYTDQPDSDLIAVGPSAISQSKRYYGQNEKASLVWRTRIESGKSPLCRGIELSTEDQIRRDMVEAFLTRDTVALSDFVEKWGPRAEQLYRPGVNQIEDLEKDGLVSMEGNHLSFLPRGRLFRRLVAHHFDRHSQGLRPSMKVKSPKLHSAAV